MKWFSKAPAMDQAEITAEMDRINDLIDDDRYKEAFKAATALERSAPGYGAYWLACCYQMGWGVQQDQDRALKYYRKTVQYVKEPVRLAFAWYMGGKLQMDLHGDQDEPIRWFRNAVEAGDDEAVPLLGQCCTIKAMQAADAAAKARRPEEKSREIAVSIQYAVFGQIIFLEEIQKNVPMDDEYYVYLGECARLLYTLACRGDFSMDGLEDDRISLYLSSILRLRQGEDREKTEKKLRSNAADVCAALDRSGKEIVGEYFRAFCNLAACEYHRSAMDLYRACWHIKRIGELRDTLEKETLDTIDAYVDNLDQSFDRLYRLYGDEMIEMIQVEDMPDLAGDYPAFKAPAPQSCRAFMDYSAKAKYLVPGAQTRKKKESR